MARFFENIPAQTLRVRYRTLGAPVAVVLAGCVGIGVAETGETSLSLAPTVCSSPANAATSNASKTLLNAWRVAADCLISTPEHRRPWFTDVVAVLKYSPADARPLFQADRISEIVRRRAQHMACSVGNVRAAPNQPGLLTQVTAAP